MPTAAPSAPEDREIVASRFFPARPEIVYQAFADPEILARWWGPAGFTNHFHEFDLRPGGRWHLVMRGPDGSEFGMVKQFVEVVPAARVVLRHLDPTHGFVMGMSFQPEAEGTRLTWRMTFDSAEEHARVKDVVVAANEQNLDRLEAQLAHPGR